MSRPERIGVTSAIRESDVIGLTDAEQDRVIAEEGQRLQGLLRTMVKDAPTYQNTPLGFQVTGPHADPLQGVIHVHTVWGLFDLDALPRDSDAYRIHVLEADGTTESNARPEGLT